MWTHLNETYDLEYVTSKGSCQAVKVSFSSYHLFASKLISITRTIDGDFRFSYYLLRSALSWSGQFLCSPCGYVRKSV